MQHGSAPASLVVWAAEAIPTPVPMQVARVTIDLMRPVPVAPLTIETEVCARAARSSSARSGCSPTASSWSAPPCSRSRRRPWRCRPMSRICRSSFPGPISRASSRRISPSSPFVSGMSMRAARGRFGVPGPGAIWYRADRPLVEGSPVSQAMRAVVAADFCNGTSAALDFQRMDLHQCRPHRQHGAAAGRRVDPARCGVLDRPRWRRPRHGAACRRRGYFGRAVQSLVIEKR